MLRPPRVSRIWQNMHVNKILLVFRLFALEPLINGRGKRLQNAALTIYSLLSMSVSIALIVQHFQNFFGQTALVFDVAFLCKLTVLLNSHVVITMQVT